MDGVELALPAAVAVSKLMGPEGFGGVEVGAADGGGGGGGVSVVEVEASESERIAIIVGPSIDRCSSFLSKKDEVGAINVLESTVLSERDTESCGKTNQASGFHGEDAAEEIKFGSKSSIPLSISMPILEGKQIQRKKVVRNNVGNSKRSRMAQMEEISINEDKVDVIKDKAQTGKQKNWLNGKRGDKRNGKAPLKSKYDCFSLKAGMLSSGGGGNNFLGIYNWKPYPCDVTKYLDDLPVNDLLDGHYKCPSFAKDKGKKSTNSSESILQSVRKACSILQLRRPIQTQNTSGIDDNYYWKSSTCPVSSDTIPCGHDSDKVDSCALDLSSHEKDSYTKPQLCPNLLEFPLCQPKDVLRRLALPLPKDLDSFLLDVAKPTVNAKSSSDSRDKQISDRACLPPFPWSHYNGGHCKSNADSSKLCVGRTTCQGRWVKIEKTSTSLEGRTGFLMNLESLTYDQSLVPSADLIYGPSGKEMAPSTSMSFPRLELGSPSSLKCSVVSRLLPESGGILKTEEDAERSPRLLEAAHTLCHIATHSSKQEARGLIRWLKKSSEKTMKACKSKTTVKSGEISAAPKSVIATADHMKNAHEILPFKKPRLLVNEKNKDPVHNGIRKGPNNWSVPRSGRSSPSKPYRDSVAETKCFSANVVKQPYTTPPPPRFLDKSYNGRRS